MRFITEDEVGVLEKIVHLIVEENLNISNVVNIPRKDGKVIIEVQIDGNVDLPALKAKFEDKGILGRRHYPYFSKSFIKITKSMRAVI